MNEPTINPFDVLAMKKALEFIHDIAEEELPHAKVGTGAEVVLRHIVRKASEALA